MIIAYLIDGYGVVLFRTTILDELSRAREQYEGELGISSVVSNKDYDIGEIIEFEECCYLSGYD